MIKRHFLSVSKVLAFVVQACPEVASGGGGGKDVVQDVFISLWMAVMDFDEHTALSAYLYASTRNKVLNWIRHNKVAQTHLDSLKDFIHTGNNVTDHLVRERMLAKQIKILTLQFKNFAHAGRYFSPNELIGPNFY